MLTPVSLNFLTIQKINGVFNVIMAGEGFVIGQLFVTVAMCETRDLLERRLSIRRADQIENSKPVRGLRRRIEPRHPTLVAIEWLADAETETLRQLAIATTKPCELEVVREIERVKILVRRGENSD